MIRLTRLNSQPIIVNSDLIKFVESNPDTVITLVNGDKILVHESTEQIVERVVEFRRAVVSGLLSIADPGAAVTVGGSAQRDSNMRPPPEGRSRG